MENLLESNERTLDIFDSVYTGLAGCLALVHADIRKMSEPREHLSRQLELEDGQTDGGIDQEARSLDGDDDDKVAAGSQANRASSHKPSLVQVLLGRGGGNGAIKSQYINSEKRGAKPHKTLETETKAITPSDARSVIDDINQQIRLALQYSKQLEVHLMKVEDLRAKYEMHLKMGLSVRSVSRAYLSNSSQISSSSLGPRLYRQQLMSSPLLLGDQSIYTGGSGGASSPLHKSVSHSSLKRSNRSTSTSNNQYRQQLFKSPLGLSQQQLSTTTGESKTTIRQFIENIERLESEFESYMGSFLLNIEDIQGFARICQGDVFKIEIRYGETQRFKTRITVLKDNRRKCDHRQTVFKAKIADVLAIKAYECKGLGRRLLLGHKLCETRDLFTPRSQLMTISLNQTGSIKLNLMITWNPLHLAPQTSSSTSLDIAHFSLPPTPISNSTLSSISSARSARSISSCDTKFNGPNSATNSMQRQQHRVGAGRVQSAIISRPHEHHLASTIMMDTPPLRIGSGQPSPHLTNTTGRQRLPMSECCADCDLNSHVLAYGHHLIPEPDYLTTSESKF